VPNNDYAERINRAVDHIQNHLSESLPLEDVARIACFSPYHFHRLFRIQTGETLNNFIKRQRLERALALMTRRGWFNNPHDSLTEIALECGFNSSTDFSRSFKQHYGTPPSLFDVQAHRQLRRGAWQNHVASPKYCHLLDGLKPGENPDDFAVNLIEVPERTVAYLRVHDSYREGVVPATYRQLEAWAETEGLAEGRWLGYTWDDPEIVAPEKCRYDVGLEVPDHANVATAEFNISRIKFPAMQVAEVEIRGGIDLEMRALDWLYTTWLPDSGFLPANHPCFEAWIGRPYARGFAHFELCLHLPVDQRSRLPIPD
jgi:AraC family transcriptional regulator